MLTKKRHTRDLILTALFTALIIIGSFIRVPVPVLPFTLQVLFTNLAALLLGSTYGALAVLAYVVLGLIGIPIFANGGGIGYIFYPTFGYLIGFIVGTYVAGKIVENRKQNRTKIFLIASFVNLTIVYTFGMVYYFFISNFYLNNPIGVGALLIYCCLLPIPGDILLCALSSVVAKRIRPIIEKGLY